MDSGPSHALPQARLADAEWTPDEPGGAETHDAQPHDAQPHDAQPHDAQPHDAQPPDTLAGMDPADAEPDEPAPEAPDNTATHRQFVDDLYQGVLKRKPDPAGADAHVGSLGGQPSFHDAATMLRLFVGSEEARRLELLLAERPTFRNPVPGQPPVRHIMSLGSHCITAALLKKFSLKKFSGPFDWIFSSPSMAAHCIADGFSTFLDPAHMKFVEPEDRVLPGFNICDHFFYKANHGIHFVFNHHDVTRDEHRQYFERAAQRFMRVLASPERSLLVCIAPLTDATVSDFDALCDSLGGKTGPEILSIAVREKRPDDFGVHPMQRRGPHRLLRMDLVGSLGGVDFTEPFDEVCFRYVLDGYAFDLAGTVTA